MTRSEAWQELESSDSFLPMVLRTFMVGLGIFGLIFFAVLPMTWPQQSVLGLLMLLIALWLGKASNSYLVTLTLMMMSCFATFRYGWWRINTVIAFFTDPSIKRSPLDAFFILVLLGAESYAYAILFLGYMQTIWPLRRAPVPLPDDPDLWPHVDLVIPTYNEPLSIVRYTAFASMNIDWPADKLHVYILDDGKREEFRQFAEEAGVGYMTRSDNKHAKAGNINRALEKLDSPYVAIFDCDHVPTRSFLQVTLGWFLRDTNLAMLQTPHHFYSPDPFERNLHQFRAIPNEGELFYGIVQDGNDFWNATFFCGSCAVLRRTALDQIGGIAVETVTEDAHTSLRMQMNGWNTAYINIPQAAGLATERLSGHVAQRIRWARGMVQILRTDNPLFAKRMTLAQRLCYFNAMTHFLYALPRLIFLTSPLIYLMFSHTNVPGYWAAILAFALPHLTLSSVTNSRIQGQHRHSFWNEIYETVLSPYILMPTLLAMINPKLGKFNVTAKGGVVSNSFFDARIAQPFVVLLAFNLLGLLFAIPRFIHVPFLGLLWDGNHPGTIIMNCIWIVFNIVILGVSTAVAQESQQRRESVRVYLEGPASVRLGNGAVIPGLTMDVSSGGAQIKLDQAADLMPGDSTRIIFPLRGGDAELPATVVGNDATSLRIRFDPLTIVEEELLTMVLYSRADTWLGLGESRQVDQPLRSLKTILSLSVVGLGVTMNAIGCWIKALFSRPKKRILQPATAGRVAKLLIGVALLGLLPARLHAVPRTVLRPTPAADAGPSAGTFKSEFTLKDLGLPQTIELRGIDGYHSVSFALPQNQVVKQATLHLFYHFSPSLLPQTSHLKVILNGTLFATLAVPPTPAQGVLDQTLEIPADLLARNNQITFEFVGHYTPVCEDPANTTLWSRIDANSTLDISGILLPLSNDLKMLPIPFFDSALTTSPVVPIIFPAQPSAKALQAAGIVTSYFGMLADYRAVRFPVTVGPLPMGNAVVIAESASSLPAELNLGTPGDPTIAVRTNPNDPNGKILIVTGGDADQLLIAADALALKSTLLQGSTATITGFAALTPRKPDDAPRWARTDDKIELWDYSTVASMQGDGSVPLMAYFRVPPDLYYADKQNVRLSLKYRYNSIPVGPISSIEVKANDAYLGSVPLPPGTDSAKEIKAEMAVPVVDMRPFSNSLSFEFAFQLMKKGGCQDTTPINMQGSILRDSYLDLSSFAHWAAMPNLELFSNAGFPFTRMADLSETTVVLPTSPSPQEIELYLTLMAHFGAQTGYPVFRVTVADAEALKDGADTDFLVIGTPQDQPGIGKLAAALPVELSADGLKIKDAQGFLAPLHNAWWKIKTGETTAFSGLSTTGTPDTMIEGLESPYARHRSVVLIVVKDAATFDPMIAAFQKSSQSGDISGTISVLHATEFESFRIGNSVYHVGTLSWWLALSIWFMEVPWMVALGVLGVCFVLAIWIRTWLRKRANTRLQVMEG